MKTLFLSLILSISTLAAVAQANPDSTVKPLKRVYVGLEVSSVSYSMWDPTKKLSGGFTPIVHINTGYKLTKKFNVQVGLTYGRRQDDELSGIYYGEKDTTIYHFRKSDMYGVAIPLTLEYSLLNLRKKLRLSATASLAPIIGSVWHQQAEEFEGQRKITYEDDDAGIYMIATAGLQLNYKISNRLDSFCKVNIYYKDISNYNYYSYYAKAARSVGIGLNYNL
jgi:hypothetical protein